MFGVEANVRRYSTSYVDKAYLSDKSTFKISSWKNSKTTGSICFVKDKGNAIYWLYIEIFTFIGTILSTVYELIRINFTSGVMIQEPKNPDYILCKDYRDHSKELDENGLPVKLSKSRNFVFDLKLTQTFVKNADENEYFKWTHRSSSKPEKDHWSYVRYEKMR
jgi:hypothetical protein